MRIDEATVQYHNIIWFAVDIKGRVILAESSEGVVPEFVTSDAEKAQYLAMTLCGVTAVDRQRKPPLDYEQLKARGFYCFVNDDPYNGSVYRLLHKPINPLCLDSLDEEMRFLLSNQIVDADVDVDTEFFV